MSHPSCLVLCSCIFSLWAFVYSETDYWGPHEADLTPIDPLFEEGETIVLNCTFSKRYSGTRNASWLAFKHNGQTFGSKYVTVLSEDTAQLRLPNATLEQHGHFVCYMLPDKALGFRAVQDVNVKRKPIKPVLQDCRVHNWEFLECSWTPSKEEQKEYSQSSKLQSEVFWHVQGFESHMCNNLSEENNFKLQRFDASPNFGVGNRQCGFQMGESYCFQVEVTNILSKPVRSDKVCFNTSDIVNQTKLICLRGFNSSTVVSINCPSPHQVLILDAAVYRSPDAGGVGCPSTHSPDSPLCVEFARDNCCSGSQCSLTVPNPSADDLCNQGQGITSHTRDRYAVVVYRCQPLSFMKAITIQCGSPKFPLVTEPLSLPTLEPLDLSTKETAAAATEDRPAGIPVTKLSVALGCGLGGLTLIVLVIVITAIVCHRSRQRPVQHQPLFESPSIDSVSQKMMYLEDQPNELQIVKV